MKIIALILISLLTRIVSGHVVVRGNSMLPALRPGQCLAVDHLAYRLTRPRRGDVVVVKGLTKGTDRQIKRIVGLPGEGIDIKNGQTWINGSLLDEPYLRQTSHAVGIERSEWKVDINEVFVMGDNRTASSDSRTYGPVSSALIEGRAWLRYWPIDQFCGKL